MDSPSIDRIDSKFGYIKGNIQVCSLWYNSAKSCLSTIEMFEMCKAVVENTGLEV